MSAIAPLLGRQADIKRPSPGFLVDEYATWNRRPIPTATLAGYHRLDRAGF